MLQITFLILDELLKVKAKIIRRKLKLAYLK